MSIQKIYEKNKTLKWKKCMLIFYADQNSEIEYGLKGYYNTESRACIKKSLTCEERAGKSFK